MAEDLVLEQIKGIRRDLGKLASKDDLKPLATKKDLETALGANQAELATLRSEMLRHFVEVETRVATEVHELIALLRELVASRDRLASRLSQLEKDVEDLKRKAG